VMDVGSTKGDVIEAARNGLQDQFAHFVPAHPIAGKEVSGIEHAEASLYVGRKVVLTPVKATLRSNVQRASQIWSGIGANVVTMTHEEHDSAFAAVSHLPHLLAFAYLNALIAQPQGDDFLRLAGPGFRDFSRIAASDPVMWRDVLLANREQVLLQSQAFRKALLELEALVTAGDAQALEHSIAAGSKVRAAWQPNTDASQDS